MHREYLSYLLIKKELIPFFKWNLFFVIVVGVFFSCEINENEVKEATTHKAGIEVGKNVNIIYTVSGNARAKLSAPLMNRVKEANSYVEFPEKIHVDFYSDTGIVESMLDAHYAKYTENESKVFLKDSVRFVGKKNGDTLYCEELNWDRNRPVYQFYTDKKVQIRTKTHIIDGVGFETSQDFDNKVIKNVTNSYIKVPTSQFPLN